MRKEHRLRTRLVQAARGLAESGLSPGRSGNLSVRHKDGMLITPSAVAYQDLHETEIVFLGFDGDQRGEKRKPSSEWRLHASIYRRHSTAESVLHCHSLYATTLACHGLAIPAFHYMVAAGGGKDIPCCGYATFGSTELARLATEALADRRACLMKNHGGLVYGDSLDSAVDLAHEVENLAQMYWSALQIGKPAILDDEEMTRVVARFKNYGTRNRGGPR